MKDRRIHALTPYGDEIVRYDRAGKWYLERPDGSRKNLKLKTAVLYAVEFGATVYKDVPGGKAFDAMYATASAPTQQPNDGGEGRA